MERKIRNTKASIWWKQIKSSWLFSIKKTEVSQAN